MTDNPDKFADKYNIQSSRLQNWNYSTPGYYFITICTYLHNNFFGKTINNKIEYKSVGLICLKCVNDISKHFQSIRLVESIVMPNHVHLLIQLIDPLSNSVETRDRASLQIKYQSFHFHRLAIRSNQTIPNVVSQFKSSVKRLCNQRNLFFGWQSRYFDIIIKSDDQLLKIKNYIINNPLNWQKDKFNNLNNP